MNETTITEDYVSFELAKLLKEKGFNQECFTRYAIERCTERYYDDYRERKLSWTIEPRELIIPDIYKECYEILGDTISAPTQQMAMKWLREKHNISVEVYRTACGYVGCIVAIPSGTDIKFLNKDGDDLSSGQYTKWEYACEATIKDCLENLETLI